MTTKSNTMRAVREQADRRGIASDLSAVVRRLDLIDRQERVRAKDARWIAQALLDLEAARKALTTKRVQRDERFAYWSKERDILQREVDARLKKYLQVVPDKDFLTMPSLKWARKVIAEAKSAKDAAAARRAARAGRPKRTARPAIGTCRTCGKANQKLNHQSICGVCSVERNTRRPASAPKGRKTPVLKRGGRSEPRDADGLTVADGLRRDEIIDRLTGARRR